MNRLEDRIALEDLASVYAYYLDTFQIEEALRLFTDDAVFDESGVGLGRHEGKEAIRRFFLAIKAGMSSLSHCNSNFVLRRLDVESAETLMYSTFKGVTADGKAMDVVFYYIDQYVKREGNWLFESRFTYPLGPVNLSAFGNS